MTTLDATDLRYLAVARAVENYLWAFDPDGEEMRTATSMVSEVMEALEFAGRNVQDAVVRDDLSNTGMDI